MKLKEIKKLIPNVEFKQMIYQSKRKIEILFEGKYKGYQFYILNLGTHPTAYVEIPIESKLFGKNYEEIYCMGIDIDVHGGLTYSDTYLQDIKKDTWFIGWDYAHYDDYMPPYEGIGYEYQGKKWTTEEIFEDVVSCIEQIIEIEVEEDE